MDAEDYVLREPVLRNALRSVTCEELQRPPVTIGRRQIERRRAHLILSVDVRAGGEQQADDAGMPPARGVHERRVTETVPRVDLSPFSVLEDFLDGVVVATRGGDHERGNGGVRASVFHREAAVEPSGLVSEKSSSQT